MNAQTFPLPYHSNVHRIGDGMVAGLVATTVISALMLFKQLIGVAPQVDVIAMLTHLLGANTLVAGWLCHFFIGTLLWGTAFAVLSETFPGAYWMRGAIASLIPWLLMMFFLMPLAGAGVFGLAIGVAVPITTLVLHLVFGAVVGSVFASAESSL